MIVMILCISLCLWVVVAVNDNQRVANFQQFNKEQLNVQEKLSLAHVFIADTYALRSALDKHLNTPSTASNQLPNQQIDNTVSRLYNQLNFLCLDLLFSDSCNQIRFILTNIQTYPIVVESKYINEQLNLLDIQSASIVKNTVDLLEVNRLNLQKVERDLTHTESLYLLAVLCVGVFALMLINHAYMRPLQYISSLIRLLPYPAKFHNLKRQQGLLPEGYQAVEADIEKLQKKYHKLDDLRNAMLRHAAHELKTPLASVNEGCSLLSEEVVGKLSAGQHEVVMLLNVSAKRLNILVERLLDYNTLLQQVSPKYGPVQLDKIINECLTDNRLAVDHAEMVPVVNVAHSTIDSDPELVRRILDNLVSNALAHGKKQHPIHINTYLYQDKLAIDVANFGDPISIEKVPNLFQPFSRGNTNRNDKVIGAGLGLSIVDECARLLNGSVALVEVDYADVCFRVVLPIHGAKR